jgi:hypothetical protein
VPPSAFPSSWETPSVTIPVARRLFETKPATVWAVRLQGPSGAILRAHWSSVTGGSLVRRASRNARTVQRPDPILTALREAEKTLARKGWEYEPGTIDHDPLPEPFASRVRAAQWFSCDEAMLLTLAHGEGWVEVDLLELTDAYTSAVRAARPGASRREPARLYLADPARQPRPLQKQFREDYRIAVVRDSEPGRYYVGRMFDHAWLQAEKDREEREGRRYDGVRRNGWNG